MKLLTLLIILGGGSAYAHSRQGIIDLIRAEAIRQQVDQDLAISVAEVESGLNPEARGSKGEIGVFQVLPRNFQDRSNHPTTYQAIQEGIRQIKYWQAYCPVKEAYTFVICYNSGFRHPKYPLLHPYYKRVMAAMYGR